MAKVIAAAHRRPRATDAARRRDRARRLRAAACAGATRAASSSARTRRRGTHNERRPLRRQPRVRPLPRASTGARSCARTAPTAPRLDADAQLELSAERSAAAVADPTVAAAPGARRGGPRRSGSTSSPARLRRQPEVRAALDRMWPVLSGTELVHDLFGFAALIRSASGGVLTDDRAAAAVPRPRSADVAEVAWTDADLALVDEADSLLGPPSAARPRRRRRRRRDAALEGARRASSSELGVGGYTNAARGAGRATAATRRRSADGRRRAAHLRARARRRGPGPHRRCSGGCSPAAARRDR